MPSTIAGLELPQQDPPVILENKPAPDLFSLRGKVASITGGSTGIGFGVAEAFAQAGADLAIWYNSHNPTEKAEELAKKYGVKVRTYQAQVTDSGLVETTIEEQVKDFGKIDVFVANAGVSWRKKDLIDEPDNSEWERVLKVNLDGAYYCAKPIGRVFKAQGYGSLIFTSSMSASIANTPQRRTCYCTSKAALSHLSRSLAVEWAGFARVNCVSPGYIRTDIFAHVDPQIQDQWKKQTPVGRLGLVQEVVGAYLYLASDASTYTTGANIAVDGAYTAP